MSREKPLFSRDDGDDDFDLDFEEIKDPELKSRAKGRNKGRASSRHDLPAVPTVSLIQIKLHLPLWFNYRNFALKFRFLLRFIGQVPDSLF